jgi:hypothetical protein
LITPGFSPRVLNDESFQDTDLGVTNSQDSVIEVSTATSTDDTLAVELEDALVSFNSNWDGAVVSEGSLHVVSGVSSDISITLVGSNSLARVVLAFTVSGSVRIVRFNFESVLSGILDGKIMPSSVATFIFISVAINDLLFREGEELSLVDEVETFNDTGGRESPAWTALTLILDWGNSTLGSPINLIGEGISKVELDGILLAFMGLSTTSASIDSLEFRSS